jgi:hypothetical protein
MARLSIPPENGLTGPYGKQLLNIAAEYAGGAKTIRKK